MPAKMIGGWSESVRASVGPPSRGGLGRAARLAAPTLFAQTPSDVAPETRLVVTPVALHFLVADLRLEVETLEVDLVGRLRPDRLPRRPRLGRRGRAALAVLVAQHQFDRHVVERQVVAERLDEVALVRVVEQLRSVGEEDNGRRVG